jgi:hypothetical protein
MLEAVADWRRQLRKVGRPKAEAPKVHIGFRLAADIVESIKATGRGYNARVEQALREALEMGTLATPVEASAKSAKATAIVATLQRKRKLRQAKLAAAKRRA